MGSKSWPTTCAAQHRHLACAYHRFRKQAWRRTKAQFFAVPFCERQIYAPSLFPQGYHFELQRTYPRRWTTKLLPKFLRRSRKYWRKYTPYKNRNQIWERIAYLANSRGRRERIARTIQCSSTNWFRHHRCAWNPGVQRPYRGYGTRRWHWPNL